MRRWVGGLLCLSVGLAAGCRKNVDHAVSFSDVATATINHYYLTEPSCLWFEPILLPSKGKLDEQTRQDLEALTKAGVVTQTEGKEGPEFQVAEAGRASFRGDTERPGYGNLCYGTPHVQKIDGTEERKDETFGQVTDVEYDSAIANPPAWTANAAMRQRFPVMAYEVTKPLPHSATLKKMPEGWSVAIGPASAIPTGYGAK